MPKRTHVYLVAHSHSAGVDTYLVRSDSPDLDVLDLVVSDPVHFDLLNGDEVVELRRPDSSFQGLLDAASDDARISFLSSLSFVSKASRTQRRDFLEGLSEDDLGLSGLSCYSP